MSTVQLYHGDCVAVMAAHIADNSIDLTVTSPPYDNLRTYNGYTFDFEAIAAQLWRVTKPGGVVVWVVDHAKINGSETGTSFKQALHFMAIGFNLHDTMIYEPANNAMGAWNEYLQSFEFMFVMSKGAPRSANLLRDRLNMRAGVEKAPARGRSKNGRMQSTVLVHHQKYGRRKNVWRYAVGGKQEIGDHPAPFPEALARDHILSWSNPGDLVLDPMMGSGTTGKMARLYGRRFVGIDISAEYVGIARKRIANVEAQPPLIPHEAIQATQARMDV